MASAEAASVGNMVLLEEVCSHIMCTCRRGLGESDPELLIIEKSNVSEKGMSTPLTFETDDHKSNTVQVNGVATRSEILEAINACDGPHILSTGIVCGWIDELIRKRTNGR